MKFTKMHGIGNDYIYVNCMEEMIKNPSELSVKLSDRHFGIGSDGLILIKPSKKADFEMEMYNADGSRGEMCGNGIRCVGKYVYEKGLTDKTAVSIETLAGIKHLELIVENQKAAAVRVEMGKPEFAAEKVPVLADTKEVINSPLMVNGKEYFVTCVSVGNEKTLRMRVWERGSGETLACGTGACAAAAAAAVNQFTGENVTVHLLGGDLNIQWDRSKDRIYMTGEAAEVFEGEIFI